MKSFLIINPFGIGDVLFSTPLIRNIKESSPESKIFYLCNRRALGVLENHPLISKCFVYERDEFEAIQRQSKISWLKKSLDFVASIKKEKIDTVLDLSLNRQFGFLSWIAGIKERIGYDYKGRGQFLTKREKFSGYKDKHVVEYHLDLLQFIQIQPIHRKMELFIPESDKHWAREFLKRQAIGEGDGYVCISPGGGESFGSQAGRKIWPVSNFVSLCRLIKNNLRVRIFILLGPKEENLERFFAEDDSWIIVSQATIMQVAAVIGQCCLFVSSDNGLLRIANALDRKIVTFFGPVDEKVYSPYPYDLKKHKLITKDISCRPCYRKFRLPDCSYDAKCLNGIDPEEVFKEIRNFLNPG